MARISAQRLAVILGFAVTISSSVAAAFYLSPSEESRARLDEEIVATQAKVRLLRAADSTADAFYQLGGLVFAVRVPAGASPLAADAIAELRRRALSQRHEGVRNYIAQLALAGEVDFAQASLRYERLVDAETKNFNIDTYRAANAFESDLSMQAVKDEGANAIRVIALQRQRFEAARERERRSLVVLALTVLGSTLLLAATLLASSRELLSSGVAPSRRRSPGQVESTAARLISLAIAEAKRRMAAAMAEARPTKA